MQAAFTKLLRPALRIRVLPVVVLVAACGTACASGLNSTPSEELGSYFTLRTQGAGMQLKLDRERLSGPNFEVAYVDGAYRGRAFGPIVDLREDGNRVTGMIGSGRTDLHIEEADGALKVRGLVAGLLTQLDVVDGAVNGNIGNCGYDLKRSPKDAVWYEGRGACGSAFRFTELALPSAYPSLRPTTRAVYLTLLLTPLQGAH